jgi:hypothetical protein
MTGAVHQPQKQSYLLVTFTNDNETFRVTNWGSDIQQFLSVPEMEIELPKNTGTMTKDLCNVLLPLNTSTEDFFEPFSRGIPFPKTKVSIIEFIKPTEGGDASNTLYLFTGWVLRTVRNPNNRPGFVKLQIRNPKSSLDKKIGVPCGHVCPWALFEPPCGYIGVSGPQKASEQKTATITSVTGSTITITGSFSLSGNKSYRDGYVEYESTRIRVRHWDSGTPGTLQLNKQPPAEWLGKTITLVPGCTHDAEHCENVWNNISQFGGIGYAIPAYNPIIEQPMGTLGT